MFHIYFEPAQPQPLDLIYDKAREYVPVILAKQTNC